jgi:hypothetical protein
MHHATPTQFKGLHFQPRRCTEEPPLVLAWLDEEDMGRRNLDTPVALPSVDLVAVAVSFRVLALELA